MANNLAIGMVIGASLASSFKTSFSTASKSIQNLKDAVSKTQIQNQKLGTSLVALRDKQAQLYTQMSQVSRNGGAGLGRMKTEYQKIGQEIAKIKVQQAQYTKLIDKSLIAQQKLAKASGWQEKNNAFRENQKGKFTSNLMTGTALAATGAGVMNTFMEQEEAANNLKISMMKADGSFGKFNEIGKIADQLGTDLPGTKKDFYNLAQALKKQGVSDDVLIGGALKTSAQLNVLLDMDQAQGGEFLAKFMEGHGLKENELAQSADYLQRAMYAGGLSKDQMYGAMSYYSVNARQLGLTGAQNTEKLLAIQAMAGQQGLEGTSFGTNFSTMLDRMNKGPKMLEAASKGMKAEAKAILDASGVKFDFWDKKGNFKGIDGMVAELEKFEKIKAKFGEEGAGMVAEEIFGTEGRRVAMILSQQGKEGLDGMLKKMREQASLQDRINQKTSTLGSALEALGGAWETAVGSLGGVFAEDIKNWAKALQGAIEKYTPFIQQHKELIKTVAGVVAGFITFKLAVSGIGVLVSTLASPVLSVFTAYQKLQAGFAVFKLTKVTGEVTRFGKLVKSLGSGLNWLKNGAIQLASMLKGSLVQGITFVGRAFMVMGRALLMNPIGLTITAIAAAAYLIYDNWGTVGPWFANLWNSVSGYFSSFCTWVQGIWNGALSWVSMAWDGVTGYFSNLWTNITAFFSSGIGNITATILNWSPLGLFYQVLQPVLSWFGIELPNSFTEYGANLINGLVNGIRSAWNGAKEWVIGLGQSIKGWFTGEMKIHSPSRVFKEYGVNVVEGLNLGVEQNAARVAIAVADMATQMKQAAPKELPTPVMKAPNAPKMPKPEMPKAPKPKAPAPVVPKAPKVQTPAVAMPKTSQAPKVPTTIQNERVQYIERMQAREKWHNAAEFKQSAVEFKPVLNTVQTILQPFLKDKKGLLGSLWDDVKFGANFIGNLLGFNQPSVKTPDFNLNASGSASSIFSDYEPLNRNVVTHNETTQNQGGIIVNFNPTINVNGNAPQGVTEQITQALQISTHDFERLLNRVLDQRQRRAY